MICDLGWTLFIRGGPFLTINMVRVDRKFWSGWTNFYRTIFCVTRLLWSTHWISPHFRASALSPILSVMAPPHRWGRNHMPTPLLHTLLPQEVRGHGQRSQRRLRRPLRWRTITSLSPLGPSWHLSEARWKSHCTREGGWQLYSGWGSPGSQ